MKTQFTSWFKAARELESFEEFKLLNLQQKISVMDVIHSFSKFMAYADEAHRFGELPEFPEEERARDAYFEALKLKHEKNLEKGLTRT